MGRQPQLWPPPDLRSTVRRELVTCRRQWPLGLTTRSTGPLAGGAHAPSARGRLAWFVRPQIHEPGGIASYVALAPIPGFDTPYFRPAYLILSSICVACFLALACCGVQFLRLASTLWWLFTATAVVEVFFIFIVGAAWLHPVYGPSWSGNWCFWRWPYAPMAATLSDMGSGNHMVRAQSIASRLTPNLSLNPDASPAALARRPLGAG